MAGGRGLSVVAQGPVRLDVLATTFGVTPRTVTEVVDGLERDGFVERRDDPDDRRARLVHVTPVGRRANTLAVATSRDVLDEIFAELSGDQRAVLSQMMASLSDRATAMTQGASPAANCASAESAATGALPVATILDAQRHEVESTRPQSRPQREP